MKLSKTRILVLVLLILGVASITWAAQPAVNAPAVDQPSSDAPAVDVPSNNAPIVPAEIDGLFVQPTETGACCRADCFSQKYACLEACGYLNDPCREQCRIEYDACILNC